MKTIGTLPPLVGVALAVLCTLARPVAADGSPVGSALYYEMNGGGAISGPLNPKAVAISGKVNVGNFELPSSCDIWNNREKLGDYATNLIEEYLTSQLNATGLTNNIINAVQGVDEVIVVSMLQRALPGLYDWMTQVKAQLDARITVARDSCQAAVSNLAAGQSPLDAWLDISTAVAWRTTLSDDYEATATRPGGNLLAVQDDIPNRARSTPITWFTGEAGSTAAKPIELVKDIVSAGYASSASTEYRGADIPAPDANVIARLGSGAPATPAVPATATSPAVAAVPATPGGESRDPRVKAIWPDSAAAAAFAVRVLGEETIAYCEGCESTIRPGLGLKPEFATEQERLVNAWNTLIAANATKRPKIEEFNPVSSQSTRVTIDVYESVMSMNPDDRDVFIYRLISDVAVENTVERGLALRRLLRSGAMTPHVQAYEMVKGKTDALIATARQEVEDLTWEVGLKGKLASNTASTLLAASAIDAITRAGSNLGGGGTAIGNRVRNGEIVQEGVAPSAPGTPPATPPTTSSTIP